MSEEFCGLDFNSRRLEKRFVRTMETLSKSPDKSIFISSESRAESKVIYCMLRNDLLKVEEIKKAHKSATIKRMEAYGGTILAVQDTTGVNYNGHSKTEGLGYNCDKTLTNRLFLIRIIQNRMTIDNKKIIDEIKRGSPHGQMKVSIPRDSRRNIKAREATLDVSFRNFSVKKPAILKSNKELQDSVATNVIYIKEKQEDKQQEPIEWILATNDPLNSFEDACEKSDT